MRGQPGLYLLHTQQINSRTSKTDSKKKKKKMLSYQDCHYSLHDVTQPRTARRTSCSFSGTLKYALKNKMIYASFKDSMRKKQGSRMNYEQMLWRGQGSLHTDRKFRWQHLHLPEGKPLWATFCPCLGHLVFLLAAHFLKTENLSRGRTIPLPQLPNGTPTAWTRLLTPSLKFLAFPSHLWSPSSS